MKSHLKNNTIKRNHDLFGVVVNFFYIYIVFKRSRVNLFAFDLLSSINLQFNNDDKISFYDIIKFFLHEN